MYNLSSFSYLCQVFCHNTRLSCVLWVLNQSRALSAIPGLLKCLLVVALSLKKPFQPTNYRLYIRSWFINNIDLPSCWRWWLDGRRGRPRRRSLCLSDKEFVHWLGDLDICEFIGYSFDHKDPGHSNSAIGAFVSQNEWLQLQPVRVIWSQN